MDLVGSGHLGSSFSSLDIVTWLYHAGMKVTEGEDRDVYFSSKGHDVPGQYAVLYSLGLLSREKFVNLRRLDGTWCRWSDRRSTVLHGIVCSA